MGFTVTVEVAKTTNFSCTIITLSTCPIYMGFTSTVLVYSFCITIDIKNETVMQKLEARTVGLKPTQIGHVTCGQAKHGL